MCTHVCARVLSVTQDRGWAPCTDGGPRYAGKVRGCVRGWGSDRVGSVASSFLPVASVGEAGAQQLSRMRELLGGWRGWELQLRPVPGQPFHPTRLYPMPGTAGGGRFPHGV